MTDRIVLSNMVFQGRHGVLEWEKAEAQRFEVDVELAMDLRPAGLHDDLSQTVDYRGVYTLVANLVEAMTFDLIEALAEAIASGIFGRDGRIREVVVRVRKPEVDLGGPLDHAAVEIRRPRGETGSS